MSARREPWWPGTWWVRPFAGPRPQDAAVVQMIDLGSRDVDEGIPLYRGVEWISPWDVGARAGDEVRLAVGWFRPLVGDHPAILGPRREHPSEIRGFETEHAHLTRYAIVDGRGSLRWLERIPRALEPLIDRVVELLGQDALRPNVTYTVTPL